MNLEHVEAVKQRIDQIRRKFAGFDDSAPSYLSATSGLGDFTFTDALNRARGVKPMPCPDELEAIIASAADKHGVDPSLIKAVIRAESGFRSGAVSRTGAQGLMQLMPGTARALGVDPTDPGQNIDGGVRYLKQQLDRFGGDVKMALAAYNAGPGTVAKYDGVPPYAETQRYVMDVLRYQDCYSDDN